MIDREPMVRMVRSFMYGRPRRDRKMPKALAILVPLAVVMTMFLVPLPTESRATISATGPLIVYGTVNSTGGGAVVGATVTVTILNGIVVRTTQSTTSVAAGFYTLTIDPTLWDIGNTIVVDASFSSAVGQNSTTAIGSLEHIDVKLGSAIPELGGTATSVLAVCSIGMLVVLYSRKRRLSGP